MSDRARNVLRWIDALERHGWAMTAGTPWVDIIAEPLLAPGTVLLLGDQPPIRVDELLSRLT